MQSLLSKELKTTILKQLSQLNKTNTQYYCMLKKLNQTSFMLNETFSDKLQSMKNDIKQKIKQLAYNIDTMYQCIDKKIGIIVMRIGGIMEQNSKYQNMIKVYEQQIKQMISLVKINQDKINGLIIKNQHLNHKNNALTVEIDSINNYKKKYEHENTNTYDSMGSFQERQDLRRRATQSGYKRRQNSYENLSPIKQPNTNSMIEQSKNFNVFSSKKLIKSEQNSFSSILIKQQNEQQQNYNTLKQRDGICSTINGQSSKLSFGCMPVSSSNQDGTKIIIFNNMKSSNPQSQIENQDDNQKVHRMSFLMQNLQVPPKSHRTFSSNELSQTLNSVKSNNVNQYYHPNQMHMSQNQIKIRQNNLLSSHKMHNRSFNRQQQNSSNNLNREQLHRNYMASPVKKYQI